VLRIGVIGRLLVPSVGMDGADSFFLTHPTLPLGRFATIAGGDTRIGTGFWGGTRASETRMLGGDGRGCVNGGGCFCSGGEARGVDARSLVTGGFDNGGGRWWRAVVAGGGVASGVIQRGYNAAV